MDPSPQCTFCQYWGMPLTYIKSLCNKKSNSENDTQPSFNSKLNEKLPELSEIKENLTASTEEQDIVI